ncbi:MAG TPA: outer membrane beta-barrel protein [Bacteroidales bacterium]|nr:outer membrane beta-barrel protein [Bacteroidales bacterium]
MKKSLPMLLFVMLAFTGSLMAQKQLYFGIGGTALSSVITNQNNYGLPFEMDYKMTLGGAGNINAGFDFNNHIGLKLEIGFAKLGQKYDDNYKDTAYTRNVKLNYLQIPILFKYRTGGKVARFYLMAGPQFNILTSGSQEYLKGGTIFNDPVAGEWSEPQTYGQETISDRYSKLDVIGRLDFGTDISLATNLYLNFGLTLGYGLMDLNASDWQLKDHTGNYNPSHNIYGGVNLGINYCIPLK